MKLSDINIRDPYVLLHEGKYYLYGTRGATCWGEADGFDVYVSDDLENWSEPIVCFHNDGSFWADRNYWAPECNELDGRFYLVEDDRYGTEAFVKEAGLYCADDKGQPVDAYNHSMDETGYAMNHFLKTYGLWGL